MELNNNQIRTIHTWLQKECKIYKAYFGKAILLKIFNYYLSNPDTKTIPIKKEFFSSEIIYDKFCSRYSSKITDEGNFTYDIGNGLIDQFDLVQRNKEFSGVFTQENQEKDDNEIESIYTVDKFRHRMNERIAKGRWNIDPKDIAIIDSYDNNDYIVDQNATFNAVSLLNNKDPFFNIVPNPTLKVKNFKSYSEIIDLNTNKAVIKTQVHIKRKISDATIITKYRYNCPRCNNQLDVLPFKLGGNDIGCMECTENEKGEKIKIGVDKKKYNPLYTLRTYIYEAKLKTTDKDSFYIYAREDNLANSQYEVELVLDHQRLEFNDTKGRLILYLLSKSEIKPKTTDKEFIVEGSGIPFENKHHLPRMKLNDIRQGMINIFKDYANEIITNEGALVQYSVLFSGLGKLLYKYNKLGVAVVGNKSLSKTFPATRFAMLLDKEYYFSQSTEDMSAAGLKGGVGDVSINGSTSKIFVHGVVTFAGLCVFDEGAQFFTDPTMNNHLKSLPQLTLKIDKIGAGETDQNYTPIILCNFPEELTKYKKKIIQRYFELSKKIDSFENQKELVDVNFFLHISQYRHNDDLLRAVAYVRQEYANNNIDWKNGGRIEASNRLLFDVVVDNQEEVANGDNLRIGYTALNPPQPGILPIVEFQDELMKKFGIEGINLFDENLCDEKGKIQIEALKASITKWFETDGRDVFEYFADGKRSIDSKLNNLIYKAIILCSLIEHRLAHNLATNVKDFMRLFLMKMKRGLLKDEYDFVFHIINFPKVDTGLLETEYDLHEKKQQDLIEKAKKQIHEEEDKENVDEYLTQKNVVEDTEEEEVYDLMNND